MKTFKCNTCGQLFDENDFIIVHEKGTYECDYGVGSMFSTYTTYDNEKYVCPFCRNENYDEGTFCEQCGEFIKKDTICEKCEGEE